MPLSVDLSPILLNTVNSLNRHNAAKALQSVQYLFEINKILMTTKKYL